MTYIQPHLIHGGVIGLAALDRRAFQRRYHPLQTYHCDPDDLGLHKGALPLWTVFR